MVHLPDVQQPFYNPCSWHQNATQPETCMGLENLILSPCPQYSNCISFNLGICCKLDSKGFFFIWYDMQRFQWLIETGQAYIPCILNLEHLCGTWNNFLCGITFYVKTTQKKQVFNKKRKKVSNVFILFLKHTFLVFLFSVASHKHKKAFLLRHIKVFIICRRICVLFFSVYVYNDVMVLHFSQTHYSLIHPTQKDSIHVHFVLQWVLKIYGA